jgi:hypothetical protein
MKTRIVGISALFVCVIGAAALAEELPTMKPLSMALV